MHWITLIATQCQANTMAKYNMGICPVIKMSKDLSVFNELKGNRAKNKSHIKRLAEAISLDVEATAYHPLLVNEHMQIIDGQHRLKALEMLKLPAYYIQVKGLGLADAQALNQLSKQWAPIDYARSFSDLGNKNYTHYLDFKKQYELNQLLVDFNNIPEELQEEFMASIRKK